MDITNQVFDLFVNREDAYLKQYLQKNGKKAFSLVKEPLSLEVLKNHIEKDYSIAVYQLDPNNMVKWGCLDFDENTEEDFKKALKIYRHAVAKGYYPLLEKSGGGEYKVHIWFFVKEKVTAKAMRTFLEGLCKEIEIKPHEIFPKQETLDKEGYGNAVKLPFGLHLETNKRSTLWTLDGEVPKENWGEVLHSHLSCLEDIETKEEPKKELIPLKDIKNPYDDFMDVVLKTELPEGQSQTSTGKITGVNDNILKNLAIWLFLKGYTLERLEQEMKPYYDSKGWAFGGLRGWFKKVEKGDIMEISLPEIKKWASTYMPQLIKLLPEKQDLESEAVQNKSFDVLTYEDFKNLKKDRNYIVEEFIKPGTITMVTSPPGQFKSLIFTGLSMAIATGRNFLDMKTKKNPVLYCDGENANIILKPRLENIHEGLKLRRNKFPLYFIKGGLLMDMKKRINEVFLGELEDFIRKEDIKVLVFDTLHRFAYYDENSSDDINYLYTKIFQPLIQQFNLAIIFLHHTTKPDKSGRASYRGSGDFLGMVDVHYAIFRQGKTNKFRIINEKGRGGEIADITGEIAFDEEEFSFIRLNEQAEDDKRIDKLKEVTNIIKTLLKENKEMKRREIIDALNLLELKFITSEDSLVKLIQRSLKFLVQKGIVDSDGKGGYRWI